MHWSFFFFLNIHRAMLEVNDMQYLIFGSTRLVACRPILWLSVVIYVCDCVLRFAKCYRERRFSSFVMWNLELKRCVKRKLELAFWNSKSENHLIHRKQISNILDYYTDLKIKVAIYRRFQWLAIISRWGPYWAGDVPDVINIHALASVINQNRKRGHVCRLMTTGTSPTQ